VTFTGTSRKQHSTCHTQHADEVARTSSRFGLDLLADFHLQRLRLGALCSRLRRSPALQLCAILTSSLCYYVAACRHCCYDISVASVVDATYEFDSSIDCETCCRLTTNRKPTTYRHHRNVVSDINSSTTIPQHFEVMESGQLQACYKHGVPFSGTAFSSPDIWSRKCQSCIFRVPT